MWNICTGLYATSWNAMTILVCEVAYAYGRYGAYVLVYTDCGFSL